MAEFGYNVPLDSATGSNRKALAQKVELLEDGTLSSISVFVGNRALTDLRLGIYSHDAVNDAPLNLLESHNLGSAPPTLAWQTISGFTSVLSAGTYWLSMLGYGDKANWGLSAITTTKNMTSNAADYTMPDPWSGVTYLTNKALLIYGTYTPAGGGDLSISTNDSFSLTETLTMLLPLALSLSIYDPVNLAEANTIQIQDAILDINISSHEQILFNDTSQLMQDALGIILHEDTAIVEFVDSAIDSLSVNESDVFAISEMLQEVISEMNLNLSDSILFSELLNIALSDAAINLSDNLNISDFNSVSFGGYSITSFDSVTIGESVNSSIPEILIIQNDQINLADDSDVYVIPLGIDVSVSDGILLQDSIGVNCDLFPASVFDEIPISEIISIQILAGSDLSISLSDHLYLADYVDLDALSLYPINVGELISLVDYMDLDALSLYPINVGELISLVDYVDLDALSLYPINMGELISLADFPFVTISDNAISVFDNLLISDSAACSGLNSTLVVSDNLFIAEYLLTVLTSETDASFYIIHSEYQRELYKIKITAKEKFKTGAEFSDKNIDSVEIAEQESGESNLIYLDEMLCDGNSWMELPPFPTNSDYKIEFDLYSPENIATILMTFSGTYGFVPKNYLSVETGNHRNAMLFVHNSIGDLIELSSPTASVIPGEWTHLKIEKIGVVFTLSITTKDDDLYVYSDSLPVGSVFNHTLFTLFGDRLEDSPTYIYATESGFRIRNLKGDIYRFGKPRTDLADAVIGDKVYSINNLGSVGDEILQSIADSRPLLITIT